LQSPPPSTKKEKDHHREREIKEKEKHKKKKGIDKNMIIRVGGGGMGMVNPMGWYDERGTPGPSPISPPKPLATSPSEPKVIDHAHSKSGSEIKAIDHAHSNSQVWGGVETPGQEWAKAPGGEEKATRPSRSALGLDLGSRDLDDDPDQVFTASPEDEATE
jgi:hypothetical protein